MLWHVNPMVDSQNARNSPLIAREVDTHMCVSSKIWTFFKIFFPIAISPIPYLMQAEDGSIHESVRIDGSQGVDIPGTHHLCAIRGDHGSVVEIIENSIT